MRPRPAIRRAGVTAPVIALLAGIAPAAIAASPATFTVTTAADLPGTSCLATCSLRQAIEAANLNADAHDTIVFAIPGGPADIVVGSALPAITDSVTIDGTTQPSTRVVGNTLSGTEDGLVIQASGTILRGLGIREFPGRGIWLDGVHDTIIGGETAAEGNEVTANGLDGVTVTGDASAINNQIRANRIFGNGSQAIDLGDDGHDETSGAGNDIGDGDTGPNGYQNTPSAADAGSGLVGPLSEILVYANARPGVSTARVEVFWSPGCVLLPDLTWEYAEATEYLGAIDVPLAPVSGGFANAGSATFTLPAPRSGGALSVTATTVDGTSEFGYCQRIYTPTDLAISGSMDAAGTVVVGDVVTFDLTVRNDGPLREEQVIAGMVVNSGSGSWITATGSRGTCAATADFGYCSLGGMNPGETATMSVEFQPTTAGLVEVIASVVTWGSIPLSSPDPNPGNNEILFPITVIAAESASGPLSGGQSLTTDTEADGATPDDPIETTVTMPAEWSGGVTIAEQSDPAPPPAGYGFAGQAVFITTPSVVDPANPYVFTFVVDGSIAPAPPIVVFRNSAPVPDCAVPANPDAAPDPCVASRVASGDDTVITVRTSAASVWRLGYVVPYAFEGFFAPVDDGVRNVVKAGAAVPVKFSLGGDRGLDVFAAGSPSSAGVACGGGSTDAIEQTVTAGGSSLSYDPSTDRYTYVWKTNKAWAGTCRRLVVTFEDGSAHEALFEFRK